MKKFSEFCDSNITENAKGTYSGGTFSEKLSKELIDYCEDNFIPNINKEHHVTILFSRKNLPNYKPAGKVAYKAKAKEFHIFEGETKVLVITLDSPDLVNRHKELMDEHKGTYDFPEYIPHITLSYDLEDYEIGDLNIEEINKLDFTVMEEYYEELNLDWKNKD